MKYQPRTTCWDEIASRSPVDRLASLAAAVGLSDNLNTTEEQILLAARKSTAEAARSPTFEDFTGAKWSKLVVVAYLGTSALLFKPADSRPTSGSRNSTDKPGLWLCRCVCGGYRALRTPAVRKRKCVQCEHCDKRDYRLYGAEGRDRRRSALLTAEAKGATP